MSIKIIKELSRIILLVVLPISIIALVLTGSPLVASLFYFGGMVLGLVRLCFFMRIIEEMFNARISGGSGTFGAIIKYILSLIATITVLGLVVFFIRQFALYVLLGVVSVSLSLVPYSLSVIRKTRNTNNL